MNQRSEGEGSVDEGRGLPKTRSGGEKERGSDRERVMGRRKGRKEAPKALIRSQEEDDENERETTEEEGDGGGGKARFFACYLLTSLCPRFKGQTYIGFVSVSPYSTQFSIA